MRLEATLPDSRGQALNDLAHDLGVNRSQLVDEAIGLFLKAILEIRRGHRIVSMSGTAPACELSTPTLATLEWSTVEWAIQPQRLQISAQEMERIAEILENPPEPSERLKAAARRLA